ncbi:hypothetical protein RJ640_007647, partial [Escallonia rubra]
MDEMRKSSAKDELKTTGQGLEWGVLLGFGPGLTVETVVLHSVQSAYTFEDFYIRRFYLRIR